MSSIHPQLRDIPWETALCFTGHRPERLPEGAALTGLLDALHYHILRAVEMGFRDFYTGLADGIDYYAADYLFRLRDTNPSLRIIGIQPCENYEAFFRHAGYSLPHLHQMQRGADRLVVLPGTQWNAAAFKRRNYLMVEHSAAIIAVCRDGRSGSAQTLHYAQKLDLAYCRIFPEPAGEHIPPPESWKTEQYGF